MRNEGFTVIEIIVVIAILVILGGGVWVWQSQEPQRITFTTGKSTTDTQSALTEEKQTQDWKTYKSEKYGFKLEYPAEYTPTSQGPNEAQLRLDAGEQISGTQPPSFDTILFTASGKNEFNIEIYHPMKTELNPNYGIAGDCGSQFADKTLNNRLDTVNSIDFLERRQEFGENKIGINFCFVSGTNNLITLRSRNINPAEIDKVDSFLRSILSTIALVTTQTTPTPSETTNWKTYTNTSNEFTFEYPASFSTIKEPPASGLHRLYII